MLMFSCDWYFCLTMSVHCYWRLLNRA